MAARRNVLKNFMTAREQAVIVALDGLLAEQAQDQRDGVVDVVQLVEGGEEDLAQLVEHPDLDPGHRLFDLAHDQLVAAPEVVLLDRRTSSAASQSFSSR